MTVTDTIKHAVGLGGEPRKATREEMSAARLPLPYRDSCAHLLIPLNRCRHEEFYLPWKCETDGGPTDCVGQNERHSYEKCQYEEFKERVKKMDELRAAKAGERSN
ncbi:uncharacterized protein yc1106_05426 [Curvularia clavata]|uniref:NADH dehydrogenase [ubiquinone] 1 beta subcomplex subunit 7 n=1 Tax=Curvularia clavata TaxID=95742 RepID=A0A9Q8Z9P4_CURCL|nr:uncharacterized protein yc1106_05426 [Curvularia clavata]